MTDKELKTKLNEIRSNLTLLNTSSHFDFKTEKCFINEEQAKAIDQLLGLFQELNWQLALNSYKQIEIAKTKAISDHLLSNTGAPVKIRPCDGDKTYFGILLGEVALSIGCSVDKDENLKIQHQYYNPAIYVPELKKIVYGCESWWGEINSKEDLEKLITQETIDNVWYMKMFKQMGVKE